MPDNVIESGSSWGTAQEHADQDIRNDLASGLVGDNPLRNLFKAIKAKGFLTKLLNHITTMWKYLFAAYRFDTEDNIKASTDGVPLPARWSNLKNWWKIFGITAVIFVVAVFSLWNVVKPRHIHRSNPDRNHHGVNRYGKRY